jgi:hypothetical protein
MGIDLKAFASQFREHRGQFLTTATLRFERDLALFAQLASDAQPCLVQPLPAGLKVGHYEDEGLRWDEVDQQGQQLTFTTPLDLRRLRLPDDLAPWNRAVLAFLLGLPPNARIVLYWC